MAVRKKARGTASIMPLGVLIGVLIGVIVILITSFILAWLIHTGRVQMSILGYASMGVLVFSAAVASFMAIHRVKRCKLFVALMTGGTLYFVLLGGNALFLGGMYQGMLTTAIMICLGSLVPAMIGLRKEAKVNKVHKKIKRR